MNPPTSIVRKLIYGQRTTKIYQKRAQYSWYPLETERKLNLRRRPRWNLYIKYGVRVHA